MKADDLLLRVIEVEKAVAILRTEIGQHSKAIDDLNSTVRDLAKQAQDFRVRFEAEFAAVKQDREEFRRWCDKNGTAELKAQVDLLKDQVKKLESAGEKFGTRAWSVVPNIVGALIAAIVAFLVAKYGK